jgi:GT2 family glycosyltransferase
MASVSAVIPNWNRVDLLERLLHDLRLQTRPFEEILLIDNGSNDNSAAVAEDAGARVIQMGTNVGFARSVNRGIEASRSEWVAVLNNDVELERDWLERLQLAVSGSDSWFATGKILRAGSRAVVDGTYDLICLGGCAWRCGEGRKDGPLFCSPRTISLAPFTAAIFRKRLFHQVGLLDERFESYLEDVDFGLRCAARGLRGQYVPEAVAYHHGSATRGRWHPATVRQISRNQVLLIAKHYPRSWPLRFGWPVLVAQALWGLVALRHRTGWAYVRGKFEGLRSYKEFRPQAPGDALRGFLLESEAELLRLQQLSGMDPYWRLYFALT